MSRARRGVAALAARATVTGLGTLTVLTVLTALAGCGVAGEERARETPADAVPYGLLDPATEPIVPATTAAPPQSTVEACFFDGERLVPVAVPGERTGANAAIGILSEPPTGDVVLETAVPPGNPVLGVRIESGVATVRLAPSLDQLVSRPDQLRFVAQVVCTLTGQPGVGQVTFTLGGQGVQVPRGDGTLASGPVSRSDYRLLLEAEGGS